ncbi:solute carrier family 22 member 20-like [Eublepharis macularius]|uniref:Solute carrier family 22 member 20-like n=1 Tax=Eublepharis macularius TaxID=481883 RepID=A0AA97KE48_EUBMA|nr:solute carrier family 22 member 20-like [Eublepharis macularius]XP_054853505.1 solute carrier family 22 member 20-like [Eublepharis macularius]XP_054853513.1 solute carrier family 22 member 20-like [Eublepharis macularius]
MAFDDVLESIGGVGRFQIFQVIFLVIPVCLIACHNFLQNFTAAVPDYHCKPSIQNNQSFNITAKEEILLKAFIPMSQNQKPEKCLQFATIQWHLLNPNTTITENVTEIHTQPCVGGWVFDTSIFESTIVSEWDLVCDLQTLRDVAQSIYMAGVLAGAVVFGVLSDRFGRRIPLISSYLQIAITGTSTAFLPSFSSYCVFRFMAGMTFSGIILNSFSLILEWTPTKGRTVAGACLGYFVTFGQIILAGVAYKIRNWRWLQLAVSVPFFIIFLCSWKLPESPRWLLLHDKSHMAVRNLKKVAVINGKKKEGEKITEELLNSYMQMEATKLKSSHTIFDLFRTPALRRITCCLMVIWFSSSFSYYGLAMDVQKFGLNIFIVQAIFGALDLPAVMLFTVIMIFLGRRIAIAGSFTVGGLMVLVNTFVPEELQTLRTAQAALGKGCLASSFIGAYQYAGELYPTEIRQTGVGFVSMQARIGAIVAPLVYLLRDSFPILPSLIFGAAPLLAGVATCFLMETRESPLLETIAEMERRARKEPLTEEEISLQQLEAAHLNESV